MRASRGYDKPFILPVRFVNAPSSEKEKKDNNYSVRIHLGKLTAARTRCVTEKTLSRSSPLEFDETAIQFPLSSTPFLASCGGCTGSSEAHHGTPPVTSYRTPAEEITSDLIHMETSPDTRSTQRRDLETCQHDSVFIMSNCTTASPAIEAMGSSSLDPFQTYPSTLPAPDLIQVCVDYCHTCLWPGLTPGSTETNMSSWFERSLSDQTLFMAFLYGALSHMRVQRKDMFGAREERFLLSSHHSTLKMVRREISSPTRAVCDSMIWCVVCLAHNESNGVSAPLQNNPFTAPMCGLQWLDIYGSLSPNLIHINGLIRMVKLRGGLNAIELPGLAAVISYSDIVTSSTFLRAPVFPFVPLQPDRRNKTMQQLLGYTNALLDHYSRHLQLLGFPRDLAEIICAINTYIDLIEQCVESETRYDVCLLADQRNACQHALLSLPPANQSINKPIHDPHEKNLYETCRLACLVYGVGIVFPLPGQGTPLRRLAILIQDALQNSNNRTIWSSGQMEAVLLWILTLGGIAAEGLLPNRRWYVAQLSRVISRSKIMSWSNMCRILKQIAWYPSACSKPGHDLWVEIERWRVSMN